MNGLSYKDQAIFMDQLFRRPFYNCFPQKGNQFIDRHNQIEVVVNHCFTSLLGTNGLLSDIVIR